VTLGEREREMNALLVLHDPVTVGDLDPLKGSFGVPGVPEVIQPGLRVVVDWIREGEGERFKVSQPGLRKTTFTLFLPLSHTLSGIAGPVLRS